MANFALLKDQNVPITQRISLLRKQGVQVTSMHLKSFEVPFVKIPYMTSPDAHRRAKAVHAWAKETIGTDNVVITEQNAFFSNDDAAIQFKLTWADRLDRASLDLL